MTPDLLTWVLERLPGRPVLHFLALAILTERLSPVLWNWLGGIEYGPAEYASLAFLGYGLWVMFVNRRSADARDIVVRRSFGAGYCVVGAKIGLVMLDVGLAGSADLWSVQIALAGGLVVLLCLGACISRAVETWQLAIPLRSWHDAGPMRRPAPRRRI